MKILELNKLEELEKKAVAAARVAEQKIEESEKDAQKEEEKRTVEK